MVHAKYAKENAKNAEIDTLNLLCDLSVFLCVLCVNDIILLQKFPDLFFQV